MGKYISNLTHTQMRHMARLRASGKSWNEIGKVLETTADELEDLTWRRAKEWEKYLRFANTAVINEAMAESVLALRKVLRGDNERLQVQASNSLSRLWATQNPKTRKVKPKKEKELTPREKFFHEKADRMAAMTDQEIFELEIHDAGHVFAGRLATYLHDQPELYQMVLKACNLDEQGLPKKEKGADRCLDEVNERWSGDRITEPELHMDNDQYVAIQAQKELEAEANEYIEIPIPGQNKTITVLAGMPDQDTNEEQVVDDNSKPITVQRTKAKMTLAHGFRTLCPAFVLAISMFLLWPMGNAKAIAPSNQRSNDRVSHVSVEGRHSSCENGEGWYASAMSAGCHEDCLRRDSTMKFRRWLCLGLFCCAGSVSADPKPADVPMKTGVDGKVPAPLTVEHFQPEPTPIPARMPASMIERMPPGKSTPTAGSFGTALLSLDTTIIPVAGQQFVREMGQDAKATLERAESHFKACNADEARRLYREVVKLAPQSPYAALAGERLLRVALTEQSPEPPLATKATSEAVPDVSELKLKVLWEAARQYKSAVERGHPEAVEKSGKVLEAALAATREPAKTR